MLKQKLFHTLIISGLILLGMLPNIQAMGKAFIKDDPKKDFFAYIVLRDTPGLSKGVSPLMPSDIVANCILPKMGSVRVKALEQVLCRRMKFTTWQGLRAVLAKPEECKKFMNNLSDPHQEQFARDYAYYRQHFDKYMAVYPLNVQKINLKSLLTFEEKIELEKRLDQFKLDEAEYQDAFKHCLQLKNHYQTNEKVESCAFDPEDSKKLYGIYSPAEYLPKFIFEVSFLKSKPAIKVIDIGHVDNLRVLGSECLSYRVRNVSASTSYVQIVKADKDGWQKIRDIATSTPLVVSKDCSLVAAARSGCEIYKIGQDGITKEQPQKITNEHVSCDHRVFSPDNTFIAIGPSLFATDQPVRVIRLADGKVVKTISPHPEAAVGGLFFNAAGDLLVFRNNNTVEMYDSGTFDSKSCPAFQIVSSKEHRPFNQAPLSSLDGAALIFDTDKELIVTDSCDGTIKARLINPSPGASPAMSFSSDGARLVVAGKKDEIVLYTKAPLSKSWYRSAQELS